MILHIDWSDGSSWDMHGVVDVKTQGASLVVTVANDEKVTLPLAEADPYVKAWAEVAG